MSDAIKWLCECHKQHLYIKIIKLFSPILIEEIIREESDDQFLKINALTNDEYILVKVKDGRTFPIINGETVIINECDLHSIAKIIEQPKDSSKGDYVKINKHYSLEHPEEVFKISKIINSILIKYKLKDYDSEEAFGVFYKEELIAL